MKNQTLIRRSKIPISVYNSSNPESKTSFVIGTLPFLGRVDEDESSLPQYPVDNAPFPESKTSIIGEESFVVPSLEVKRRVRL